MTMKQSTFENARLLGLFINGAPARGNAFCVPKNKLVDGNYFVLDDGTNPAVTFYYDVSGAYVPGGGYDATHVRINVSGDTTGTEVAATTDTAINGAVALALTSAVDTNQDNVLNWVNDANGTAGNVSVVRDPMLHSDFVIQGMADGTDPIAKTDIVDILPKGGRWVLYYEN